MNRIIEKATPVAAAAPCHSYSTASSLRDVSLFLSDYASWLFGSGATCIRLEQNVDRMALAWDCRVVMTILPRHINITVSALDNSQTYTYIIATCAGGISFDINTQLSRLSWEVADGRIDFDEARHQFQQIIATRPLRPWVVMLLASLANASFCRLFGGDTASMAMVFAATFCGYYLKVLMCSHRADIRVTVIVCAFVSAILGAGAGLFHLGNTPEIAVGTSVLYLVPGIPFINSFSDMLAGHYICAFSRFVHAAVLTACLSIGLCAAMMIMNLGMF